MAIARPCIIAIELMIASTLPVIIRRRAVLDSRADSNEDDASHSFASRRRGVEDSDLLLLFYHLLTEKLVVIVDVDEGGPSY
ncbi:hypothetical protein J5N97_003474 [Dioscorea zingiberensis]|uniref:Uncharacterized protein n=1 Tax=Dioscorea zingiberensis TaxID=325984 RepID=A0A9D5D6N5_9LILI|nr:hypothetical protein J5N97_003474 [Dioscorea zingiberensis]